MTEHGEKPRATASAPGKVILAGEYAVLDGAPAICMAIDRRARVTVAPGSGDCHVVEAPGFAEVTGRFRERKGGCEWLSGRDEFRLFDKVWCRAGATSALPLSIVLDTSAFLDTRTDAKIGVGSSAALTVALAVALYAVGAASADPIGIARVAHREFQTGLGSGADVACCAAGGLIEFTMAGSVVRQLEWPDGLRYALLWSGVPVSTAARLEQLRGQDRRPARTALVSAAEKISKAWQSGSAGTVVEEYRSYIQALRDFSNDCELGIFDAGHAALTIAADRNGLVYKPCGAGGGDVGIAFADDQAAIDEFVGIAAGHDFRALHITLDPRGVQTVQEEH